MSQYELSLKYQVAWESLIFNKAEELFPDAEIKHQMFVGLEFSDVKDPLNNDRPVVIFLPTKRTRQLFARKTLKIRPMAHLSFEQKERYKSFRDYCWTSVAEYSRSLFPVINAVIERALHLNKNRQLFEAVWRGEKFNKIHKTLVEAEQLKAIQSRSRSAARDIKQVWYFSQTDFQYVVELTAQVALNQIEDSRFKEMLSKFEFTLNEISRPLSECDDVSSYQQIFNQLFNKFDKEKLLQDLLSCALEHKNSTNNSYFSRESKSRLMRFLLLLGYQEAITIALLDEQEAIRKLASIAKNCSLVQLADKLNSLVSLDGQSSNQLNKIHSDHESIFKKYRLTAAEKQTISVVEF